MRLSVGCELVLETDASHSVPLVLMLCPSNSESQWIAEKYQSLSPMVPVREYTDCFGNLCQRLESPPGRFTIRMTVVVETVATIEIMPEAPLNLISEVPNHVLQFLLPSRYCPSDLMGGLANQIVEGHLPGYDQVAAICDWIHRNIKYCYGTSDAFTSAQDTVRDRSGVCRDFAHLGIALCRSLTIPARMVVGYLNELKPMDMHAWFEAFVGGRWYTFDATQEQPRGGRITVATGRDAADVALITQFGPSVLTEMCVWVNKV